MALGLEELRAKPIQKSGRKSLGYLERQAHQEERKAARAERQAQREKKAQQLVSWDRRIERSRYRRSA